MPVKNMLHSNLKQHVTLYIEDLLSIASFMNKTLAMLNTLWNEYEIHNIYCIHDRYMYITS